MTTPTGPPPKAEVEAERPETGGGLEAHKPLPLQLALPAARASAREAHHAAAERGGGAVPYPMGALGVALGALVLFAALAVVATVFLLPWYVKRQSIEAAAAHGIDLSVDEAKIDPEGFRLIGVRATSSAIRGVRARAPEVEVETSRLRPQRVTVRGAEVTLSGRWATVDSDLAKWRASPSGGQAGEWAPASLALEGARIVWQAPIGENVRVEATDVHAEVAWHERAGDAASTTGDREPDRGGGTSQRNHAATRGADTPSTPPKLGRNLEDSPSVPSRGPYELHVRSDHVTVSVPGGSLGPWRVDVDRSPPSSRVRVALDPGVPEACTILIVHDGDRVTSVDVVVPRSPLAHLGVPDQFLGAGAAGDQVEATIHYTALGPARADASASGAVHGIEVAGLPRPIDVAWEGTFSGDPSAGVDVRKARLAVGPLVGPLSGTLKRFDDGFRVDLAWAAGPVPCAGFAASLGLGQPFEIGYELRKLAEAGGTPLRGSAADAQSAEATKIRGDVRATVMLSFDSRDLGATKLDFTPEITCKGALFR